MENELIKAANLIRKHCRGDASCLECPFTQPVGRSENCSLHSIPADWPEFNENCQGDISCSLCVCYEGNICSRDGSEHEWFDCCSLHIMKTAENTHETKKRKIELMEE